MQNELVAAIDAADAFLTSMAGELTRADVETLKSLAADVYRFAFAAGLADALPKVVELAPEVDVIESRRPVYESKLNVPGDWLPVPGSDSGEYKFYAVVPERWRDDMQVLRSIAAASPQAAVPTPEPAASRIVVDLEAKTATFDGERRDVRSERALRWLAVLVQNEGKWIPSSDLEHHDPELIGAQPHQFKKMLPPAIFQLIDSSKQNGYRLRLN